MLAPINYRVQVPLLYLLSLKLFSTETDFQQGKEKKNNHWLERSHQVSAITNTTVCKGRATSENVWRKKINNLSCYFFFKNHSQKAVEVIKTCLTDQARVLQRTVGQERRKQLSGSFLALARKHLLWSQTAEA